MGKIFLGITIAVLTAFSMSARELIPDKNQKGKWGYIDESGAKVIDYRYDYADFFVNGRAKVGKDGKYGFIDEAGKELIKIKYNILDKFKEGVYKVAAGGKYQDGALLEEKYGFIDYNGNVLLEPKYEVISQFNEGVAWIQSGNKYGYINESFVTVIPCEYTAIGTFNKNGVTWVNKGGKMVEGEVSGGKFGLLKKSGEVLIKPDYSDVGVFVPFVFNYSEEYLEKLDAFEKAAYKESGTHHLIRKLTLSKKPFSIVREDIYGYYFSKKYDGSKNGVMDKDGNVLMEEGKYQHAFYPTEGLMYVKKSSDKINYLNMETGQLILKNDLSEGWAFHNGLAVVGNNCTTNRKGMEQFYGVLMSPSSGSCQFLIDKEGKAKTKLYTTIFPCKEEVYLTLNKEGSNKYGMLGIDGREIVPAMYDVISPSSNGLLLVRKSAGGKFGFLDKTGTFAIADIYQYAFSFRHGLACVEDSEHGLWGMINPQGQTVLDCKWRTVVFPIEENPKYLWAMPEGSDAYVCVDLKTQQPAFGGEYKWIRNFNADAKGVALVGLDDSHIGCIDMTGKVIIPLVMERGSLAFKAYQQFVESGKSEWEEIDTYRFKIYNNEERNKKTLFDIIDSTLWDY